MLTKVASITAPINHYQSQGKQHTFYKPVGSLMLNPETNQQFLLLDKSFNPMSVIDASNPEKGSIYLPLTYVDVKAPVSQNKPIVTKKVQSVEKPQKTAKASKQAIQAALSLLQNEDMRRQNKGKDGKHIDLPFDDELNF